jgi:hypothetical protein
MTAVHPTAFKQQVAEKKRKKKKKKKKEKFAKQKSTRLRYASGRTNKPLFLELHHLLAVTNFRNDCII